MSEHTMVIWGNRIGEACVDDITVLPVKDWPINARGDLDKVSEPAEGRRLKRAAPLRHPPTSSSYPAACT